MSFSSLEGMCASAPSSKQTATMPRPMPINDDDRSLLPCLLILSLHAYATRAGVAESGQCAGLESLGSRAELVMRRKPVPSRDLGFKSLPRRSVVLTIDKPYLRSNFVVEGSKPYAYQIMKCFFDVVSISFKPKQ